MGIQREIVSDEDEKKAERSDLLLKNIDWAYVLHVAPLWLAKNENGSQARRFKSFPGLYNHNTELGIGATAISMNDAMDEDIQKRLNLVNITLKNKVDLRNERIQQGNQKIQNIAIISKFLTSNVMRNSIYKFIKENSVTIFSNYLKYFYFLYKRTTKKSDKTYLYQRAYILSDLYEKLKGEDISNISTDLYYPESEDLSNYSANKSDTNIIELFMLLYTYTNFHNFLLDEFSSLFLNMSAEEFDDIIKDFKNQTDKYIHQGLSTDDAINKVLTNDFSIKKAQGNIIKFYDYITDVFMDSLGSFDKYIKGTDFDVVARLKYQLHSELFNSIHTDYKKVLHDLLEKWGMKEEDFDISDVKLVPLEEETVEYCENLCEVFALYYKDLNLIIKVLLCSYIRECEFFTDSTLTTFGNVLYEYLIDSDFNVNIDIMSNDFYSYLNTFFITLLKYANEVDISAVDTVDLDCIVNGDMFKVKQFEERNLNYYFIYDGSGLLL